MEDDVEFTMTSTRTKLYTFGCSYTEDCGEKHLKDNIVYHGGQTYILKELSSK